MRHFLARSLTAAGTTAVLLAAGVGAASAHVHVSPDSTQAGENAMLTFETSHGCSGSPTTAMTVTLPDQVTDAVPTAHPGWSISKVTEEYAEPRVLANGTAIGSRTSQVVFTADEPLPDGVRDTFTLSVKIPDAEGEKLVFPVLQSCVEGETDWQQVPAESQSEEDLDAPAPAVTVTAAGAAAHDDEHDDGTGHDARDAGDADDFADEDDVEAAALAGYAGLGAGLLGLLLGAAALYRSRKA